MTDAEKREQIGALVEEYSRLKEELAQVDQKLSNAQQAYIFVGENWQGVQIQNGRLMVQQQRLDLGLSPAGDVNALLSAQQLAETLLHRDRLEHEIQTVAESLKPLAPHLL